MTQKKSESKSALEKKAKVQALRRGPDLDCYLEGRKRKFVSYAEGAKIYSINYYSFVGFGIVYSIIMQQWTNLLIFAIIGGAIIAALFMCVVVEEVCDVLSERIERL